MEAQGTKVIDKDKEAVWVVNMTDFRFSHGAREGVIFEPKIATRIKMDEWIKGQGELLAVVEDPHNDELPPSPVKEEKVLRELPDANAQGGKKK